tara:strand:- start:151 stop:672 length:522 start_codon:yes stop_codon:yes gene_type:complete
MINWSFFPKTDPLPKELESSISVFESHFEEIDSSKNDTNELRLTSDKVLAIVSSDFMQLEFEVETGKKASEKIRVPVLFGHQGNTSQAFEVDGYHRENQVVLEIESGRAYTNHQFLKDIFEASVMVNVKYLILAVRTIYKGHEDYKKITEWLNTLFITDRIKFDLKGILVIGY